MISRSYSLVMQADIEGPQRKVMASRVRPAKASHGDAGIALKDGATLPFNVRRSWSAPAGHYPERWYLVHPSTREVLYEGPERQVLIWGLQALTEVEDQITDSIALDPGTYNVVFSLGGLMGGQIDVEAYEAPAEAAA